jgi:hypothetical protein
MKSKILTISLLSLGLALGACEREKYDGIPPFEDIQNGGYMRTIAITPDSYNATDSVGSTYTLTTEAYDKQQGALLASYDLRIRFRDNTPTAGNRVTTYVPLRSIAASAFARSEVSQLLRSTFSVTIAEALTATQLRFSDINPGDEFEISAEYVMTDGRRFGASNSSGDVIGGAFYSSPFFYRIAVGPTLSSLTLPTGATRIASGATLRLNGLGFGPSTGNTVTVTVGTGATAVTVSGADVTTYTNNRIEIRFPNLGATNLDAVPVRVTITNTARNRSITTVARNVNYLGG